MDAGEELVAVLPGMGGCDVVWLIVRREGALAAVLLAGPLGVVDVALTALLGQPALKQRIPWSMRWVRNPLMMVTQPIGDPEIARQHERAVFKALGLGVAVFAAFTLVAWWHDEDLVLLTMGLPAGLSMRVFAPWLARGGPGAVTPPPVRSMD